jgi:hypothetical protein
MVIDVDQGIAGEQVIAPMARIALTRGTPRTIRADNGPKFISKARGRLVVVLDSSFQFKSMGSSQAQHVWMSQLASLGGRSAYNICNPVWHYLNHVARVAVTLRAPCRISLDGFDLLDLRNELAW